ncbi:MAG: hypothetical protein V4631_13940 [Pseudomonadota bacterium]
MKFIVTAGIFASTVLLTACATPAADPASKDVQVAEAATYEDKGEMITGSRIPQKSTTHVVKRVGNAEYKKSKQEAAPSGMDSNNNKSW